MTNKTHSTKTDIEVGILAFALPEAYKRCRKREKPRFRIDDKFNHAFWTILAVKLHAIGGNADGFMEFHFGKSSLSGSLYEICNDRSVEEYRLEIQTDAPIKRADDVVQTQLERVYELLNRGLRLRQILLDPKVEVNPLISYCLAIAGELKDLSDYLAPHTATFLKRYPAYRSSKVLAGLFVEPPEDISKFQVRRYKTKFRWPKSR